MRVKLKPVEEQVIVITGATSGIGLATAHAAVARGAKVVLVSRDETDLGTVQAELEAEGSEVLAVAADVADRQKMSAFDAQRADGPPRDDDTLWAPRAGDVRVRGTYPGHVATTSVYTAVARRPVATGMRGLAVLGLGVAAARAWMHNRAEA